MPNHNAGKTHCRRGHAYDERNTYITPAGYRQCRRCKSLRMRQAHNPTRIVLEQETCAGCGAPLNYGSRRRFYCGDKCQAAAKRDKDRTRRLLREYGLTVDEFESLVEFQGGVCAICARTLTPTSAAVDHDHVTGVTRGVLCFRCNRHLLPACSDDASVLIKAANYLDHPPAVRLLGEKIGTDPVLRGKRRKKKRRAKRVALLEATQVGAA